MEELIEMGTVSSRGQIAIPSDIRSHMDLNDGSKVIFVLVDDSLLIKKITSKTFEEITKPLKEAARKASLKEKNVPQIVHRFRKAGK